MVAAALEHWGRVDTLVNTAGIFLGKPFTEYTLDDLHRVFDVNVAGFFHMTQRALAPMLRQEHVHIVQITATLVQQPLAAIPSGLAGLTKGGLDAATRGIRVDAVAPGIVRTPLNPPDTHGALNPLQPMGRLGDVDDVVDAVLYLERAGFVTGEVIHVDGSQHAGHW